MSNKQKNIGLVVGFLLLLIISYVFSIQKTIDLKTTLASLEKDKELVGNAEVRILSLEQENKYLDSVLQQRNLSIENSFQQTLFKKINNFSKEQKTEIISFKEPHSFTEKNATLMTYSFEIKGSFNTLLKLVNTLERDQLGELIGVNFLKKKNYRRNKEELIGEFYIQKLEQKN